MYRLWLLFEPRKALSGLVIFLAALAFLIHILLLTTDDHSWLSDDYSAVAESAPLPAEIN